MVILTPPPEGFFPGRSAADLRHRAGGAHKARVVDLVLELLVANGEAKALLELRIPRALSARRLQVPRPAREGAGAQLAVGGQSQPVAARAERLRHGIDEPDLAGAVG